MAIGVVSLILFPTEIMLHNYLCNYNVGRVWAIVGIVGVTVGGIVWVTVGVMVGVSVGEW